VNTPGHAIVNLALLGRRDRPELAPAILAGAIVPDLAIVAFYLWQRLVERMPERAIWEVGYFQSAWQPVIDLLHSLPLAALGYVVARLLASAKGGVFFASLALHSLADLPLHHEDAHRHLFPFSDWRFASPLSYWDPRHYGGVGAAAELLLVAIASVVLWRRHRGAGSRTAVAAVLGLYVAGYAALYLAG
jgi:hypothetical protein